MIKHIPFRRIASIAAISSQADRERVDRLRADSDAVMVEERFSMRTLS